MSPASRAASCSPPSAEPLPGGQAERVAPLLNALGDPVRLRLMSLVASHAGGEAFVCDPELRVQARPSPTISHHLKVLHDAGLVDREARGVRVIYRLT